jgi:translation initiation factor 1 (eIF-1/SUI1)
MLLNALNNNNCNNILLSDYNIEIWIERHGKKKNTFISGWEIPQDEIKKHIQYLKKKNGCNGTYKKITINSSEINVIVLQGDHIDFILNYLVSNNIDLSNIHIKG